MFSTVHFQAIIHKPTMYAETSILTYPIHSSQDLHLSLDATLVMAESDVKSLDVTQRACFFSDEGVIIMLGLIYVYYEYFDRFPINPALLSAQAIINGRWIEILDNYVVKFQNMGLTWKK